MTADGDSSPFMGLQNAAMVNPPKIEATTIIERTMVAYRDTGVSSTKEEHVAPKATFLPELDTPQSHL